MKRTTEQNRQTRDFGAVMTPPGVVEQMLDMLSPDTWCDPHIKLCEPSVGDGAFIAGMVPRLMAGLAAFEPDPDRRYRWIFEHIIYAVDIQPAMIAKCVARFHLDGLKHNFIVGNFLTMDVENWKA